MQNIQAALTAFLIAFGVTAAIGPAVIKYLRKLKFGQIILEIGPKWHMNTQYTPTMGGFMFISGMTPAILIAGLPAARAGDRRHIAVLCLALAFGAIGFIDDYTKVVKKRNQGLTALQKLLLQVAVTALFLTALRLMGFLTPHLYVPFLDTVLPLHWAVFMMFAAFAIVAIVNAVNLTDGIDGLAASVTLPVAIFFAVVFMLSGDASISVTAWALAGGVAAFLIYNHNPARVFMGDTGSLFLGGMICGLAFASDLALVFLIVGAVYIAETVSVVLQVGYFKLTHGKRLFKMAPLHHHFEMCGWNEKKIVAVFALVTALLCLAAFLAVRGRYAA